jgi:hypothetical protein
VDPQEELRRHLKPATMVGAALIASLVMYLGLVEVVRIVFKPFHGFVANANIQPIRYAAFGAAAVVILLILILRPRQLRKDGGEDASAALQRLQRGTLLTLVLGETPAILGLALFLVAGSASDFYKFLFASILLTFINFPRRTAWEEWLKG